MQKVAFLVLFGVIAPSLSQRVLPTSEVDTGSFGCPTQAQEMTVLTTLQDGIQAEVQQNIVSGLTCRVGECETNPATSCQDVQDRGPGVNGMYWIRKCDGTTTQVYCAMNNPCGCSGTGAWTRVGLLNMTDPAETCPHGMTLIADPRACSRNVQPAACVSFFYDTNFVEYNRVCGRALGYQESSPDAFTPWNRNQAWTVDDPYVDGMSITYGFSPRKHIWSFAAGVTQNGNGQARCPCVTPQYNALVPPFIGNDWFCNSGAGNSWARGTIYRDNPLWDGQGCINEPTNSCCTANNPPWFCKDLPLPSRDNIEVRACGDQGQNDEDVLISYVEIYVQ